MSHQKIGETNRSHQRCPRKKKNFCKVGKHQNEPQGNISKPLHFLEKSIASGYFFEKGLCVSNQLPRVFFQKKCRVWEKHKKCSNDSTTWWSIFSWLSSSSWYIPTNRRNKQKWRDASKSLRISTKKGEKCPQVEWFFWSFYRCLRNFKYVTYCSKSMDFPSISDFNIYS